MKRILINATHAEEIRVALCKDNHLYDFDLENRTREQKKANIYKAHITRIEPSLEAVFVEYGSMRQGFLPLREIAPEYLSGNPREDNLKQCLKEGDELIIQVEKEERGNKGAALSTYISLAGRYLVLMPNNAKGGGISRQISGKVREEMRTIINDLSIPKGMSVIVRTAGIGKTFEDLQLDLNHLLDEWQGILAQNAKKPSPCLLHQEAGVVTRAMRDYLRDDIGEVWIDSENAYNEAAHFISQVMPTQMSKLRKYKEHEPMFAAFGIERQIETAYQREVRLPSGGSIVIDQTEAMVAIDINSAKSTKGSDVAETAYHTNLEAAEEIARQLRLRDMGGLIVIDFIDMSETRHQKDVEKRLIDATRYDRARVQFAEISKFGLMEMSRQRLRPSLEEATGYICPRCHGNGMIRDLRSLALSIMRQIEQIALHERSGEVQVDVPTEIAAFLLNEKRESLVYLEQDSGTRITILPHAHLESPNFTLHFNPDGYAPATYDRITDVEEQQNIDRGYDANWHTEQAKSTPKTNHWQKPDKKTKPEPKADKTAQNTQQPTAAPQSSAVAWLSNLFAPKPEAKLAASLTNQDAAAAIESIVNGGQTSLGAAGQITLPTAEHKAQDRHDNKPRERYKDNKAQDSKSVQDKKPRYDKTDKTNDKAESKTDKPLSKSADKPADKYSKREADSRREPRAEIERKDALKPEIKSDKDVKSKKEEPKKLEPKANKADGKVRDDKIRDDKAHDNVTQDDKKHDRAKKSQELIVRAEKLPANHEKSATVHLSLDDSKQSVKPSDTKTDDDFGGNHDVRTPSADKTARADSDVQPASTQTQSISAQTAPTAMQAQDTQDVPEVSDVQSAPPKAPSDTTSSRALPSLAQSVSVPAVSAPIFDDSKLIAIAKAMNLAKNDPRVVKKALSAPIQGTAGQFIRAQLTDANERLSKEGFVACFIAAINQGADFDFANYGYQALPEDEVRAFDKATSAAAQFDTAQGKTIAPPRAITKRATNDPRGQHPSLVEDNDNDDKTANATILPTQDAHILASSQAVNSVSQHADELLAHSETNSKMNAAVDSQASDVEHLGTEQSDASFDESKQDEHDTLDTIKQSAEQLAHAVRDEASSVFHEIGEDIKAVVDPINESIAHSVDAVIESVAHLLQSAVADNESNAQSKQADTQADTQVTDVQADKDKPSDNDKSEDKGKTSIDNYKHMIENVAEQLLPQTGILNLVTPKTNKVKIRKPKPAKPKTEARKRGKKEVVSEIIIKKDTDNTLNND